MKQAAMRRQARGGEDSRSSITLPPDILQAASRRVGLAALIFSGAWIIGFLKLKIMLAGGAIQEESLPMALETSLVALSLVLSLGVFLLSRSNRISPVRLFDVGLGFGIIGSFLVSFGELWQGLHGQNFVVQRGVSWVCVWMMTFPLLMPASPRKTFFALVISALTAQMVTFLAVMNGAALPSPEVRLWLFLPNIICAGIAFLVARMIYQLGAEVSAARELGSYRLVEKLGQGGMGEVWQAQHRMLARPAAIKLIRPEALGTTGPQGVQTLTARFEREAQATASLQSPHTIRLYDFGMTDEGVFYYVMELLRGMDLSTMVKRFGPISPERAVYLLIQACHSLAEAHTAGLIHRDIKPANLYACRLGLEDDFVKILDFGLVKSREGAVFEGDYELTQAKTASGTPAYMPPEIATGEPEVDGRADIYALGCVGYWLLTGQHVFEESTPMKVVLAHVQTPPSPPSRRSELSIPPELDRIILDCLEKKPARRPQHAAELAARLGALDFGAPWNAGQAHAWWETNLPDRARHAAPPPAQERMGDTVT